VQDIQADRFACSNRRMAQTTQLIPVVAALQTLEMHLISLPYHATKKLTIHHLPLGRRFSQIFLCFLQLLLNIIKRDRGCQEDFFYLFDFIIEKNLGFREKSQSRGTWSSHKAIIWRACEPCGKCGIVVSSTSLLIRIFPPYWGRIFFYATLFSLSL